MQPQPASSKGLHIVASDQLSDIVESIRQDLTVLNTLRDETLQRSRALIRSCAHSIRAVHRHDWDEATELLTRAREEARAMVEPLGAHPTLYHAGYTQDALKELVEAHLVYAVVRGEDPPLPADLQVAPSTYLRGMSEAGTEMRRFVLDLMRRGEVAAAEPYLDFMDEVYSLLITVDFPDAITDGLRRHTDVLRTVLERTRGDLTMAIRQDQMRHALRSFETRLAGVLGDDSPPGMGDWLGGDGDSDDDGDATGGEAA
jgi:translin